MTLNVNPYQPFEVTGSLGLSSSQLQSLSLLYQPIIGAQGLSLYLTLLSMTHYKQSKKSPKRHTDLLNHMNYGIQDLNQSRLKLEGLDLMRTFRDPLSHPNPNHQTIYYKVIPALTAESFFKKALLRTALFNQLGEADYETLVAFFFKEEELDSYQEETANFEQVFTHFSRAERKPDPSPEEREQPIYSTDFDYGKFMQFLIAEGINHQLFTTELREQVLALHQIYKVNESQMANLVYMATDKRASKIDFMDLNKLADRKFKTEDQNASTATEESEKSKDDNQNKPEDKIQRAQEIGQAYPNLSQADIKMTIMCEQVPNDMFLYNIKKAKKGFPTDNEQFYVKDLVERFNLKPEVINFLLYYLLIILDKKSVFKGDLQRYANEWQQAGVTDVPQAIMLIAKAEQEEKEKKVPYKSRGRSRSSHKEIVPSWMKEEKSEATTAQAPSEGRTMEDNEQDIRARLDQLIEGEGES